MPWKDLITPRQWLACGPLPPRQPSLALPLFKRYIKAFYERLSFADQFLMLAMFTTQDMVRDRLRVGKGNPDLLKEATPTVMSSLTHIIILLSLLVETGESLAHTQRRGQKWPQKQLQGQCLSCLSLLVFSVTPFRIEQNKNQNRSIDKVQNLGNERRYIYQDPRQDSGQRNISYTRYAKKCFT